MQDRRTTGKRSREGGNHHREKSRRHGVANAGTEERFHGRPLSFWRHVVRDRSDPSLPTLAIELVDEAAELAPFILGEPLTLDQVG